MPQKLYSTADQFSSIVLFGPKLSSTAEYYVLPRLTEPAKTKLVHYDPYTQSIDKLSVDPRDCLIIINRYVTRSLLGWLKRNRSVLGGVLWVLDDDLEAMAYSRTVPTKNKVKPAITLYYQTALKQLVDHLLVSTHRLQAIYSDWPVQVIPPTLSVDHAPDVLDSNQLFYFAKMHLTEHEFLFPVVKAVLEKCKDARFTVIAEGKIAEKWRRIARVSVLPELSVGEYADFLDKLDHGGIFLVPLMNSKINDSRSDAKIIEVVRSGSAVLTSNARAYRRVLQDEAIRAAGIAGLQNDPGVWIKAISELIEAPETAICNRDAMQAYVANRHEQRNFIV